MEAILKNRYAMLVQLVAADQTPECLAALEQMAWRDVRGFIQYFESHGCVLAHAAALIQGCVRMTNAQIRQDRCQMQPSWAAKWVPREPKCRGSPLLMWYYDALAADMFPGVPDANRRYRQLISALTPPQTMHPTSPTLAWFVRQAERAQTDEEIQEVNALWRQRRFAPGPPWIPVLSLAQSMGPGHNNCLHAGIGLALHLHHLHHLHHLLTFSAHAEWHALEGDDFVLHAQQLLCAARSPTNGLNANSTAAVAAAAAVAANQPLLIISDMEHDEPIHAAIMTWNVSRNGRPASFCGDRHNVTATTSPPQRHRHNVTATTSPPQRHRHNAT